MSYLSLLLLLLMVGGLVYTYRGQSMVSLNLVLINFLLYAPLFILQVTDRFEALEGVYQDLGFRAEYMVGAGRWWAPLTLFSSLFIHGGPYHLMGNMLILILMGTPLETRIGSRAFLALYLVSGLGGSLLAGVLALLGPVEGLLDPGVLGVGASGAIFGIMGAFVRLYPRDEIPMLLVFIFLQRVPVIVAALLFAGLETIMVISIQSGSAQADNVGHVVHLTAFFVGLALAPGVVARLGQGAGAGAARHLHKLDLTLLEPLARQQGLGYELSELRRADEPELRQVWAENLWSKLRCPDCRHTLGRPKGTRLSCDCGFSLSLEGPRQQRQDRKGS